MPFVLLFWGRFWILTILLSVKQHCAQGRTLGGGGAKPPLASECYQKSVPFFLDTVRKLGPKMRVQELICTSVSEFGPTTEELVGKIL
jgi:hypothetical protein